MFIKVYANITIYTLRDTKMSKKINTSVCDILS